MAGSIESGIQFLRYKMDKVEFSTNHSLRLLEDSVSDFSCEYQFGIPDAICYEMENDYIYVVPLLTKMTMFPKDDKTQILAQGEFQITGLFTSNRLLDKEVEEKLIKVRGPAILFPFMRANVSNILMNTGFAQIEMPLVDVGEMSKQSKNKIVHIPLKS